ncbi:bone marrow proteoglycan-like isoform X2 [Anser cygnoides]|uniref:bone marrow proteoglycan-like isoform X2 n=2 Tax=Anser cygnoides TaxID=8845 RepID=UPI0034D2988D
MALPGRKRCLLVLPGQRPTMQPCLLLALALLGTASARHLAAVTSEVAEPELEAEAEDVECPLEDETKALNITDPQSARTFRYIIVRRCQNFHTAQRVCSRCYRGRLASIHSYHANVLLQCRARTRVNNGRVWIGAITRPVGGSVFCHWSDNSGWNYAYWLHGYPLLTGRFCTTLCTANGRWRSTNCRERLPFICEY